MTRPQQSELLTALAACASIPAALPPSKQPTQMSLRRARRRAYIARPENLGRPAKVLFGEMIELDMYWGRVHSANEVNTIRRWQAVVAASYPQKVRRILAEIDARQKSA